MSSQEVIALLKDFYSPAVIAALIAFVLMEIICIRLAKRLGNTPTKLARRVERAKANGHVLTAKRVKLQSFLRYTEQDHPISYTTYTADYEYSDGRRTRSYRYITSLYGDREMPPAVLTLYYDRNPAKVFRRDEPVPSARPLINVLLAMIPFAVGAFVLYMAGKLLN